MSTYEGLKAKAEFLSSVGSFEIAQADQKAYADSLKVNSTSQAQCEITYISTGVGQHRVAKPVIFPVTFRKEPHFTSGCSTVKNTDPKVWNDPIGQCGLYAWKKDTAGNYTGAYIWTRVEVYPIDPNSRDLPPESMSTLHYMTFSAVAGKDLTDATGTPSSDQLLSQLRDIGIASAYIAERTDN